MSTSNRGADTRGPAPTDSQLWMPLAAMVFDNAGPWRQRVTEVTGMPFSRFRALRRLDRGPLTGTELAARMDIDAAAASVAVGDLADHGLVTKTVDPQDSRRKIVALTDSGRELLASIASLDFPSPVFDGLDDDARRTLFRILTQLKENRP